MLVVFVAHYKSPDASGERARGLFEFESTSRLGSKANAHDARIRMLELYGKDALAWTIIDIEHKAAKTPQSPVDGQMELDFRDPIERPSRRRRAVTKRGVI